MTKKLVRFAQITTLGVSLFACVPSKNKQETPRVPASEVYADRELQDYLKIDPFAKDGYDHNQDGSYANRRFQFGTELPKDQEIRELAGREIWFKSAPNERFHSYYFPQKINSPIAWNKVLRGDQHDQRFQIWGLINDPDCCVPGKECAERGMTFNGRAVTMADTFGWEYCAGDEKLLNALRDPGRNKWEDPACANPILKAADALDGKPRESRCELAFGNPTGAVGYRKFPNPRFNAGRWQKVGGWEGFEKRMESAMDASIEPPFRVGKSCASCHAAFDPLNVPRDLANPSWKNIKGETGNQYINVSAILGSGVRHDAVEYQMFVHARAGVVDTSAIPNDFVNNPGTINAIINFPKRPTFEDRVSRWLATDSCSGEKCQTITYPDGRKKYWEKVENKSMSVMHILKGGEDSVGPDLAVQRVYANIGMCAEQCWVNHLPNVRELDSSARGYGQTPFDIAQCRADCASWRANEDRVGDILSYLLSRRPTDLKDALFKDKADAQRDSELAGFVDKRYGGENLVARGQDLFARNCAQCHSSQNANKNDMSAAENFLGTDFFAKEVLENGEELRTDWMGNDKSTRVDEVGTFRCRSLHSNHVRGQVWEQFASETVKNRAPVVKGNRGQTIAGGRGYYRNISLLNAWAHAPFMHNNAIGPEICGNVPNRKLNMWRTTVDGRQVDAGSKYTCEAGLDPSIEGRLRLFDRSVDELLTPSQDRRKKVALMDEAIRFPLGLSVDFGSAITPLYLEFPLGMPVNQMTSLDIKGLSEDLMGAVPVYRKWQAAAKDVRDAARQEFDKYWIAKAGDEKIGRDLAQTSLGTFEVFRGLASLRNQPQLDAYLSSVKNDQNKRLQVYLKYYSNCDAHYENMGHDFGTQLSAEDKKALKAFLVTL